MYIYIFHIFFIHSLYPFYRYFLRRFQLQEESYRPTDNKTPYNNSM